MAHDAYMKAVVFHEFGGSNKLQMAQLPRPEPASGEVLIRVSHTSVNPVDWKIREGLLRTLLPHRFPIIPGWDAAGTVEALGGEVRGLTVGDRVYSYCRKPVVQCGTYAQFVTMSASAVAKMPSSIDFAQAAGIPLVGLTSWQALFDAGGLQAGQTVLIHAGAGGLGSIAIQLAKHAGARVIVTASAANHEYVRGLGADLAIDYNRDSFVDVVRAHHPDGIDLVYATVGGSVLEESYKTLKKGGTLVSVTGRPTDADAARWGVRVAYVFVSPNGEQLARLAELLEARVLRPPAMTLLPIEDAARAQDMSRAGKTRGKIVLAVGD
jgi:NADPH2:quinone reductase